MRAILSFRLPRFSFHFTFFNRNWTIVDEAFADTEPDLSVAGETGRGGLLVLRSLGKFFGLAGLRVGFVIGAPHMIAAIAARLGPWSIGGAALDVFETEPLPADHPLWKAPHFLMTPHVAAAGPYLDERRLDLLIENCRRVAQGEELINIVDKTNWF